MIEIPQVFQQKCSVTPMEFFKSIEIPEVLLTFCSVTRMELSKNLENLQVLLTFCSITHMELSQNLEIPQVLLTFCSVTSILFWFLNTFDMPILDLNDKLFVILRIRSVTWIELFKKHVNTHAILTFLNHHFSSLMKNLA